MADQNSSPTRDPTYYFHDGSCVIQAEEYLFKIQQSLLERDSNFFKNLFSLPQSDESREGKSDSNPIICQDSVDDFRALCWVLYARPNDIRVQQTWETADIARLVRVVAISHKYEFQVFRDWALDVLQLHSTGHPDEFIPRCGEWKDVDRILNLCYQAQREALGRGIEEEWLRRIRSATGDDLRTTFEAALDTAESSPHLREFHGKAYYQYLKAIGMFGRKPLPRIRIDDSTEYIELSPSSFNEQRRLRLHEGFWSLTRLRLKLSEAPKIGDNPSCPRHTTECVVTWDEWWKETLRSIGPSLNDPGDFIREMERKLPTNGTRLTYLRNVSCQDQIVGKARLMSHMFDETLANHFMIP